MDIVGIGNSLVLKIIVQIGCLNFQKLSQYKRLINTHINFIGAA